MKNVKNLFGMAVMATALVGCSSNDNLNPNPNDNAGKAGEAYASFKINLPTTMVLVQSILRQVLNLMAVPLLSMRLRMVQSLSSMLVLISLLQVPTLET